MDALMGLIRFFVTESRRLEAAVDHAHASGACKTFESFKTEFSKEKWRPTSVAATGDLFPFASANVFPLNGLAVLLFIFVPMREDMRAVRPLLCVFGLLFFATAVQKKGLKISVADVRAYIFQVIIMSVANMILYAPFIVSGEVALNAVASVVPHIPFTLHRYLPKSMAFMYFYLALRIAIFVEMLYSHQFYRAGNKARTGKECGFFVFFTDLIYSLSYGCATYMAFTVVFEWFWDIRASFRNDAWETSLLLLLISKFTIGFQKPLWSKLHYFGLDYGTNFYIYHRLMHHPNLFYVFHGDHHLAVSQCALVGVAGTGFWEGVQRVPMDLSCGPLVGHELNVVYRMAQSLWDTFAHHYYDDCPWYVHWRLTWQNVTLAIQSTPLFPQKVEALYYPPGPDNKPILRFKLHGDHHWRNSTYYGSGLDSAIDLLWPDDIKESNLGRK